MVIIMRRMITNAISVVFTLLKFCTMKIFMGGRFKFSPIERFSPNVVTEFNHGSMVTLGRKVRVHSGSKIKARRGAKLCIGDNTRINYNCIFICHNAITIGEGTEFGPSVYIYDHDHDYKSGLKNGLFSDESVDIGKNCWIGANTVILKGTKLGDNCVVGAGTVLKGSYPDNMLIVQKRVTDKKNIEYM